MSQTNKIPDYLIKFAQETHAIITEIPPYVNKKLVGFLIPLTIILIVLICKLFGV